jgi:hypothetical protein
VINISDILNFDVDVFSHFQYSSAIDNERAKWIVRFIKEDQPMSGKLIISEDNPEKFYNFFHSQEVQQNSKILLKIKLKASQSDRIHLKNKEVLRSRQELRIQSYQQLFSRRSIWYALWRKRAGIQMEEIGYINDPKRWNDFQINLTMFLFSIGTILEEYHQADSYDGKDLSTTLLNQAFILALELEGIQIKPSGDKEKNISPTEFLKPLGDIITHNRCMKSQSLV